MMQHKLATLLIGFVVLVALGAALSDDPSTQGAGVANGPSTEASPQESSQSEAPVVVEMPKVTGLPVDEASNELVALGLDVRIIEKYSHQKSNTVIRADSSPGEELGDDEEVELVVAEPYPRVPFVAGKARINAVNQLKNAGFRVRVTTEESSKRVGTVIALNPRAGTELLPGEVVTLVVAKRVQREAPACDPNYSGYCVPLVSYDLDCANVGSNFRVVGSDPHGFDGDSDGYACES
jgi:hypothetical protein